MSAQDIRELPPPDRSSFRGAGPAYWRRYLARVPDWAIADEDARRREDAAQSHAIAIGDDFLVDLNAYLIRWRGVDHGVRGRPIEVVHALAVGWLAGKRRLRSSSLARMVWLDRADDEARMGLWNAVSKLRRQVPDLVVSTKPHGLGYHLAIPTDAVARRVECNGR